jgi:hypothetical protein
MAVINITAGTQAILTIAPLTGTPLAYDPAKADPGSTDGFVIPLVQDVTVNASPGIVRYSVLDNASSKAFTTVNENSISANMLLDEEAFFGDATITGNQVGTDGLFSTSTAKTEVSFSVAFEGTDSGDYFVYGTGYISGLAPSASMDAAIWLSPVEIVVNGELTKNTVT